MIHTPEFQEWFLNSKIVDEKGQPAVMYRGEGSGSQHEVFDRTKTQENGFFFTPDFEFAAVYGNGHAPREFYIRAPRFMDLRNDDLETRRWIHQWADHHERDDFIERETGDLIDPVDAVQNGRLFDWEGDWSARLWRDLHAYAERQGLDAILCPDWDNGRGTVPALIVFNHLNIRLIK